MGTINVSLPSDGTTADVSDYNTPITTIVSEINGNLDNANIASAAAIAGSKIADDGITASKVDSGFVVQVVKTQTSAYISGTTQMPFDDTIPQNTEGNEFMTLAITPKSSTNILVIEVTAFLSSSVSNALSMALFQDSTADAIAATMGPRIDISNAYGTGRLVHTMVAGTTSSTTFKFRAGLAAAGTVAINGSSGARKYGGVSASSITITEYKAS